MSKFTKIVKSIRRKKSSSSNYGDSAFEQNSPLRAGLLSRRSPQSVGGSSGSESESVGIRSSSKGSRSYGAFSGANKTNSATKAGQETVMIPIHVPSNALTYLKHKVESDDTFARLSLKYGVSVDDIKRANHLYDSDSIFLKKELLIPITDTNQSMGEHTMIGDHRERTNSELEQATRDDSPIASEEDEKPSAKDFLAKFDSNFKKTRESVQTTTALAPPPSASDIYKGKPGGQLGDSYQR